MNFPERNNDIDFIERYLDGELTPEEQQSFNKRMIDDQEFKELVEARKESSELWVKARTYAAIKEDVKRIHSKGLEEEKISLRTIPAFISQYKYYAIAASGLLLIGVIAALIFIVNPNKQNTLSDNDKNKLYQVQNAIDQMVKGKMETVNEKAIVLLKPDSGAIMSAQKDILFQWKYKNDSPVEFVISNENSNTKVFTKKIDPLENSLLIPAGTLMPGVYSWYITVQKIKRTFTVK